MPSLIIDVQNASNYLHTPKQENLEKWLNNVFFFIQMDEQIVELTLRFTDTEEIQTLNKNYRDKDKPTNVLSFPATYNHPESDICFLGDLIICLSVVEAEAIEQNKTFNNHLAHMITHGLLHLLGYDHILDDEAKEMETLEIEILGKLSIPNPYEI